MNNPNQHKSKGKSNKSNKIKADNSSSRKEPKKDPRLSQYYQQINDEAMNEQKMDATSKQFSSALQAQIACATGKSNAALDILSSPTSASVSLGASSTYEGDDEEDEDTTLALQSQKAQKAPQKTKDQQDLSKTNSQESVMVETVETDLDAAKPTRIVDLCNTISSNLEDEPVVVEAGEGLDFVHVQLEHLPSADGTAGDEDSVKTGPMPAAPSPPAPKMRSQSQPPPKQKPISANGAGSLYHVVSEGEGTTKNSFSYYRKFAAEGSSSFQQPQPNPPSPPRLNPLVASLQNALSFHSQTAGDSNKAMRDPKDIAANTNTITNQRKYALQGDLQPSETDIDNDMGESNQFDFVNMDVDEPVSSVDGGDIKDKGTYTPPMTQNNAGGSPAGSPVGSPSRPDNSNKVTFSDAEDIESRGGRYTRPLSSYPTSDEENYDSDDLHWQRLRHKQKSQLTLMQTMQHNTRANFCAIFLLGVALATLILTVVAKLTNNRERLFYDEVEGSNVIFTDNERLLTIEVLALALILVLLLGSMVYCDC